MTRHASFPKRMLPLTVMAVALLLAAVPALAAPPQYTNSLILQRADAHIYKHTDGYYYFTASVPEYDRIILRRATSIQGLASAQETVIWRKHASGEMGAHIWAPEIHFIGGKWYIYFAAGASNDIWRIRMYALESSSANPLTGSWTEKGRISTGLDSFSLDATTVEHNGQRYMLWAQSNPDSNVYIAKMSSPITLAGAAVLLTKPEYSWEIQGYRVNEGPAVIKKNGKIFVTYSASKTDDRYCLGLLTASASSDLLHPASWTKSTVPVLASNVNTSQYGPGHNSFTVSEDGQSDLLVYHARNYKTISGDPLYDPNRHTRVQKIYWNADGTPNFGIPLADGVTPFRFKSYNKPTYVIRHWEFRGKLEENVTNLADSQFRLVPGLAASGAVSLESANYPGYYLRHKNFEVWVEKSDGSTSFKNDASFYRRTGLADSGGLSFESYNYPGRYLRHSNFLLYVQAVSTATDSADATFITD
ncbi:family 43 glycosylhydrolase [Stigmatella sp. ncwal1]|uniref:Family 43 glycosylhydrolase n=1 Tax=Stigmatella ashevillensis TaxID=2995309 RepID=A0ABT5DJC3_9BACT|nr:family 43 glycosylhydrolase [Stigmatella ashevillena]MDC0713169.1 family 43 glycosylhydrolase [Stigmatella ashevillena]